MIQQAYKQNRYFFFGFMYNKRYVEKKKTEKQKKQTNSSNNRFINDYVFM